MAIKTLISGLSNAGKTTLLETLKNAYVLSHDGKNFPYAIPHTNVPTFDSSAELINLLTEKIQAYKGKFNELPKTIAIDSVSKIFDTIYDNCNRKHTGFKIYSEIDIEIKAFTDYIQNVLIANGMNVVLLSHALYDADSASYSLVGKGSFQKRGGFLAEVDNAVFLETKNNKRIVHNRSTKFPARTLHKDLPDSQPVEEFNLQDYIVKLEKLTDEAEDFIL